MIGKPETTTAPMRFRIIAFVSAGVCVGFGVVFFAFAIIPGIGHVPYEVTREAMLAIAFWGLAGFFRSLI